MQLFALLVICGCFITQSLCGKGPGTTKYLREMFIGRCWDYQQVKHKDLLPSNTPYDCNSLWTTFEKAFAYKGPCDVTYAGYQPFMTATKQAIASDKSMFWSGIYNEAHEYGNDGKRYVTLEDTLLGYLVNGLIWCGKVSKPGIDYDSCPTWGTCSDEATKAFWGSASTAFALAVKGVTHIMLEGSNPNRPAFSPNSFFAEFELPNLNPKVVTKIVILILHTLEKPGTETCQKGSVLELKKLIQKRGIKQECYDNPEDIVHMLCIDAWKSRECQFAKKWVMPKRRH